MQKYFAVRPLVKTDNGHAFGGYLLYEYDGRVSTLILIVKFNVVRIVYDILNFVIEFYCDFWMVINHMVDKIAFP